MLGQKLLYFLLAVQFQCSTVDMQESGDKFAVTCVKILVWMLWAAKGKKAGIFHAMQSAQGLALDLGLSRSYQRKIYHFCNICNSKFVVTEKRSVVVHFFTKSFSWLACCGAAFWICTKRETRLFIFATSIVRIPVFWNMFEILLKYESFLIHHLVSCKSIVIN